MEYYVKNNLCYASLGGAVPAGAEAVSGPSAPLILTVRREPVHGWGFRAISDLNQLEDPEGPGALLPTEPAPASALADFVREHGASVLNTTFPGGFDFAEYWFGPKPQKLTVTLVGLGDVGGTVLTALKLLGRELGKIQIFDFNQNQCRRYAMELNQVLPMDQPQPEITVCREEQLFDCDLFLFTASRGVPPVGQEQVDVRMAQYEANRSMITAYAKLARAAHYRGLFCQISDPVDLLARAVYLESNRGEAGHFDWQGLLPEQVQGFGLGVMAARARYYAPELGLDPDGIQVYGPHGQGLVAANCIGEGYDPEVSERLSQLTREANLRVRDLGFKPYIAPGISSAAISILQLVRGQDHYGAVPLGQAYFGCRSRFTKNGLELCREAICPDLMHRLEQAYQGLILE